MWWKRLLELQSLLAVWLVKTTRVVLEDIVVPKVVVVETEGRVVVVLDTRAIVLELDCVVLDERTGGDGDIDEDEITDGAVV